MNIYIYIHIYICVCVCILLKSKGQGAETITPCGSSTRRCTGGGPAKAVVTIWQLALRGGNLGSVVLGTQEQRNGLNYLALAHYAHIDSLSVGVRRGVRRFTIRRLVTGRPASCAQFDAGMLNKNIVHCTVRGDCE